MEEKQTLGATGFYQIGKFKIRKNTIFTVIAILIPFLFFILLEILLRFFGYGKDYPLFVEDPNDSAYWHMNEEVSKRYFTHEKDATIGHYGLFLKEKTENTFRIFVQGESSAAGFPFQHGGSFHFMLEKRLEETFPDKNIEIINTALTAVNSYTLLDFADEIIAQKPDVILIYAGHNEFYGALGVGSAQKLGGLAGVIRFYLRFRQYRVIQFFRNIYLKSLPSTKTSEAQNATLMEKMVEEQKIPFGSPLYEAAKKQFSQNLDALLQKYKKNNIPVLIGNLVSNEKDQPPFISEINPEADPQITQEFNRYFSNEAQIKDTLATMVTLQKLLQMDSSHPGVHYRLGQLLLQKKDFIKAKIAFQKAKDYDLLKFRAPSDFNTIIREKAKKYECEMIDIKQVFERKAKYGIVGNELMVEHLHPNIEGYFQMASAFYHGLEKKNLIGVWNKKIDDDSARKSIPVTVVDSIYGQLLVLKLKNGWPFQKTTPKEDPIPKIFTPKNFFDSLALQLYYKKSTWINAMLLLDKHYQKKMMFDQAMLVAEAIILEFPNLAYSYEMAGEIGIKAKNYSKAIAYLNKAYAKQPAVDIARKIGIIYINQDSLVKAEEQFTMLVNTDPQDRLAPRILETIKNVRRDKEKLIRDSTQIPTYVSIAQGYMNLKEYERAEAYVIKARKRNPKDQKIASLQKEIAGIILKKNGASQKK